MMHYLRVAFDFCQMINVKFSEGIGLPEGMRIFFVESVVISVLMTILVNWIFGEFKKHRWREGYEEGYYDGLASKALHRAQIIYNKECHVALYAWTKEELNEDSPDHELFKEEVKELKRKLKRREEKNV